MVFFAFILSSESVFPAERALSYPGALTVTGTQRSGGGRGLKTALGHRR